MKLISYQYLIQQTDISENIPNEELDHPIHQAGETLRMLLGESFFTEISTQYPNSLSPDNTALYDPYIKQYLAWQAYYYWLTRANFKQTRSGIRVHQEENSVAATAAELAPLFTYAKSQSQYYKTLMVSFIVRTKDNDNSKYPLYKRDCGDSKIGSGFSVTAIKGRSSDEQHLRINKSIYGD